MRECLFVDCKLTGQAALALETLARQDFEATVTALTERFEPEAKAKRLLYQEKLFSYQKKKERTGLP